MINEIIFLTTFGLSFFLFGAYVFHWLDVGVVCWCICFFIDFCAFVGSNCLRYTNEGNFFICSFPLLVFVFVCSFVAMKLGCFSVAAKKGYV